MGLIPRGLPRKYLLDIIFYNKYNLKFIAIGKDIVDNNPISFAEDVFEYVKSFIEEKVNPLQELN